MERIFISKKVGVKNVEGYEIITLNDVWNGLDNYNHESVIILILTQEEIFHIYYYQFQSKRSKPLAVGVIGATGVTSATLYLERDIIIVGDGGTDVSKMIRLIKGKSTFDEFLKKV
jgi:hypothetical protein